MLNKRKECRDCINMNGLPAKKNETVQKTSRCLDNTFQTMHNPSDTFFLKNCFG